MQDLLAHRIMRGDQQAFELLFSMYYTRLCGFANKFLKDYDEAQDIAQQVFCILWEGRESIDSNNSIKAYLFRIAQNLSISKLRRKEVESRYAEIYKIIYIDHTEFSAHESLLAKDVEEAISLAISKLPFECAKVFKLSRIEGLKYAEIANTLNISIKTVETQISKALSRLRIDLFDYTNLFFILLLLGKICL